MAVTALTVATDRTEYSRHETDRDVVTATVTPTGSPTAGSFTLSLIKARRARDVVVATWTVDFDGTEPVAHEVTLSGVVDESEIPLVRRGNYFFRANADSVNGDSPDFIVSLITIDRLLGDYLYGLDLKALQTLNVLDQPQVITGATVVDVSPGHPRAWFTLTHTGPVGSVAMDGTAAAGSTATVVNWTGGGLTVSAHVGKWLTWKTEHRRIQANAAGTVTVDTAFSAAPAATDPIQIQEDTGQHFLSWCSGPQVKVIRSGDYTLRRSRESGDAQYIKVRAIYANLPVESTSEDLLVSSKQMDMASARGLVDKAISEIEDTLLGGVFLEPTRMVSQVSTAAAVAVVGTSVPTFPGVDWDRVGTPISYYRPSGAAYVNLQMPYKPILTFNSLAGWIGGNVALSVPTDWIQFNPMGGFVELVPFTLEALGRFVGVLLFQSVRGDAPIPSFWRYDVVVGFRETPQVLIEAVAKIASIDFLTIAGQATNNAYASKKISRDGVSEEINYTSSAMFGIFSASITDYNRWLKQQLPRLRGAYRGPQINVMVA